MTDEQVWEKMILLVALVAGGGWLLANWHSVWSRVAAWLIAQHVLVVGHPVLVVPGTGGAGLDGSRLAIGFAVVAAVVLWTVSSAIRAIRRRQEQGAGA